MDRASVDLHSTQILGGENLRVEVAGVLWCEDGIEAALVTADGGERRRAWGRQPRVR
jgi:hypothetical protein